MPLLSFSLLMKISPVVQNRGELDFQFTFPGGTSVKNLPAIAGDTREVGSIPGSGRSPEEGLATHSSILAWRVPWTEEAGRL